MTFDTIAKVKFSHYFYIKAALMAVGCIGGAILGEPNNAFIFAGVVSFAAAALLTYLGE
jgi:hypothetical protein